MKTSAVEVLCYSCIYEFGTKCLLYNIPILHDSRFCDGYEGDSIQEIYNTQS